MAVLHTPLRIGSSEVRNRLYRAPVLEGAGDGPDCGDRYAEHFVANARTGVGLVIQGSSCLYEEGRSSPGMTLVHTRERVMRLAPMVDAVHREGAAIWLQVGHAGLFAMEAWHEPYASARKGPLLGASPLPWYLKPVFRRRPIHVMTADDVHALAEQYGNVAAWAREAGYDGIQLGSSNAKLLDQFLSPFYNRRTDQFGGSTENRARVLRLIRDAIAEKAGEDYCCTVKVPVGEKAPPGFPHTTWDEGLALCRLVEEWGFHAFTPVEVSVFPDTALSRGGIPRSLWSNKAVRTRMEKAAPSRMDRGVIQAGYVWGGLRNPFVPVWNRAVFTAARQKAGIPVHAVGGIRTTEEVETILEQGQADLVGIGRPFYAEPDLPRRILGGSPEPQLCRYSNLCVPPQMLGMKGVCYNPQVARMKAAAAKRG